MSRMNRTLLRAGFLANEGRFGGLNIEGSILVRMNICENFVESALHEVDKLLRFMYHARDKDDNSKEWKGVKISEL